MSVNLRERFLELRNNWKTHCRNHMMSSITTVYLDCDAFRELVLLGHPIIPLIFEVFHEDDLWWFFVLNSIVHGETGPLSFNNRERMEYWDQWWNDQSDI